MDIRHLIAKPDILSLLNVSTGFLAIIQTLSGNLLFSAQLMLLAIVFDSLDGWVARRTKRIDQYGFGKNIDSLADVISFGAAPAVFLYVATSNFFIPYINILVGLLIVICGVLRLARFNVMSELSEPPREDKFIGLPIPATALVLGSFYLSGMFTEGWSIIIMVLISMLMISTIEYPKIRDIKLMAVAGVLVLATFLPIAILSAFYYLPAKLLLVFASIYVIIVLLKELYAKVLRRGPHVR